MNKLRQIAASIAKSFNSLRPNWAILSVWAGMEVFVSAYFGWNLLWSSDAELFADLILLVVFALGLYSPPAPVTNINKTYVGIDPAHEEEDDDDLKKAFEEKYGSGCQGYGCEGCDDCKVDDDMDHMEDDEPLLKDSVVDTEGCTGCECVEPCKEGNADRRA